MLNPFPELLVYSLLAPFILRVVAGLIFVDLGILLFKNEKQRWLASLSAIKVPNPQIAVKILGMTEIITGIMLILGLYTQIATIILAVITFKAVYIEYREPAILKRTLVFYILLLAITLSLLLSGAGAFAIDLP